MRATFARLRIEYQSPVPGVPLLVLVIEFARVSKRKISAAAGLRVRSAAQSHNEEMRLAIQRRVNPGERKLRVLPVILPNGCRARRCCGQGWRE